jgi:hypothetical protein
MTTQTQKNNRYPKIKTIKYIYSSDDYNSNDGMLTSVWGPAIWHYLHTMSFNYPVHPTENDKQHYRHFLLQLKYVLPCGKCRKNLQDNFKKLPLTKKEMESRGTFSKYVYELHELINTMLGKKSGLSYEEVRERYEHFRSRCVKSISEVKKKQQKTRKNRKEKGCTEPLYGEKSKCVLRIVPQNEKCQSLEISKKSSGFIEIPSE